MSTASHSLSNVACYALNKLVGLPPTTYMFAVVFKHNGLYFPKIWWGQPCYGELAQYTAIHGDGPNSYRPSDLADPFPFHGSPVRLFVRSLAFSHNSTLLQTILTHPDNPWKSGLDNPKVSHGATGTWKTGAAVNLTVTVNFMKGLACAQSFGNTDLDAVIKRVGNNSGAYTHNGNAKPRFTGRDPILYLDDKKFNQRGNYYRGGMRYIWDDEPHNPLRAS